MSKVLLLLTAGLVPVATYAQMPGFMQRLQIGYGFAKNEATYTRIYPVENTATLKIDDTYKDTTITMSIKPSAGYNLFIGTNIPVAKLGKASALVFSIEASYTSITWENAEEEDKRPLQKTKPIDISGTTTIMGAPLGFDIKYGCDAYPDKSYRWCTTLGVGAMPLSANTTIGAASNTEMYLRPYIRGEVGVLAGMCFKLRGTLNFGRIPYINIDESKPNSTGNIYRNTTSLTSKPSFNIALVVMPFASTWNASRWWN